jgi:hypothetical protein
MAKTPRPRWNEIIPTIDKGSNEQSVGEANIVVVPPFTTIQNRAKVEANCKVVGPVERIRVNSLREIPNEFGTNGETVYTSDKEDSRIRFVGSAWSTSYGSSGMGPLSPTNITTSYAEITFYGTGLNFTSSSHTGALDWRFTLDNGVESANILPEQSGVLNSRNYSPNIIIPVVSGLSLDWHTVRIRKADTISGFGINSFEILNESSDLTVLSGSIFKRGYEYKLESNTTVPMIPTAYSGTNGGRVLTYIDENFQVQQAVNEVGTPLYLASADHSNEAIYRKVNFREFGRNRTDDFSTIAGGANDRAFTLDDGTTTLVGNDATSGVITNLDAVRATGAGAFITLTFVGTGLDLILDTNNSSARTTEISIDGGVFTQSVTTQANEAGGVFKVASGLPYGTHTVRFLRDHPTNDTFFISDFIIYQPKKPTVAKELPILADYNLMADFVANTVSGLETMSTGVLRKNISREITCTGTWSIDGSAQPERTVGGFQVAGSGSGTTLSYTFFGTGLDARFTASFNRSNNITVDLNGTPLTTSNFGTANISFYGTGVHYDSVTATLDQLNASQIVGCGLIVSNLPLDLYTINFTCNDTDALVMEALDIITPIHSPNLMIGSLGISDEREKIIVKERELDLVFSNSAPEIMNSTGIAQIIVNADDDFRVYLEDAFIDKFYKASFMGQHTGGSTSNKIISRPFGNPTDTQSCINIIIEGNADQSGTSTPNCDWISVQIKGKQQKDVFKD